MKHSFLSPLGKRISVVSITLTLFGCASNIHHDLYAVDDQSNNPIIEVTRDNKTAKKIVLDNAQECNTNFYINNKKVGSFAINEQSRYQLAPGQYTLSADNCQGRCSTYGVDVEIKQGGSKKFTLSADATGKPFIIVNQ